MNSVISVTFLAIITQEGINVALTKYIVKFIKLKLQSINITASNFICLRTTQILLKSALHLYPKGKALNLGQNFR